MKFKRANVMGNVKKKKHMTVKVIKCNDLLSEQRK